MRRKVKIYLKSGQTLVLRGVKEFEIDNGKVSWKMKTRGWKLLTVLSDEIEAVVYK